MISTWIQQLISGGRLFLVWMTKNLVRYPLKRKNQAKTFTAMIKSEKVGETVVQMSSDQLSQRLLAIVVRDEAPLLEIFSREPSGVAPSLFHDNGEMRKSDRAELMNGISTILTDVLMESAFRVIGRCAWFYRI